MTQTIELSTTLVSISCGNCGGVYAIGERYHQKAREEGTAWNCPYCRIGWGFTNRGENAELKRKLAQAQTTIEHKEADMQHVRQQRDHAEYSARTLRGVVTKTKKRIGRGICPCCNRTFSQLADHMQSQHPEYVE